MNKKLTRLGLATFSFTIFLTISVTVFAGNPQPTHQHLTVFAASSLADAMDQLADSFEFANPGVKILRHYASSTKLAAQLIEGVNADVFASANEIQMGRVIGANLASEEPLFFATNQLTLAVPAANPGEIKTPADLAKPGVSLVLAAPATPIRVYSDRVIEILGDAEFQAAVYRNLVSEEANVRQVVAKIALGEADAGFVYASDITSDVAGRLTQVLIPQEFNLIAAYPMVRLAESENPVLAQTFIDYILSPDGQAILAAWGFGPKPSAGS